MQTPTKDIELQAACTCDIRQVEEIFTTNNLSFYNDSKPKFSFNQYDLLNYLRTRPELCEKILNLSYGKRYSPSTFMEEFEDKYRVGWFDKDRQEVRVFDKFHEAVADFVLLSWYMPRLHIEEHRLPEHIRKKIIMSGNEFGWRHSDFAEVVETARQLKIAVRGGSVPLTRRNLRIILAFLQPCR